MGWVKKTPEEELKGLEKEIERSRGKIVQEAGCAYKLAQETSNGVGKTEQYHRSLHKVVQHLDNLYRSLAQFLNQVQSQGSLDGEKGQSLYREQLLDYAAKVGLTFKAIAQLGGRDFHGGQIDIASTPEIITKMLSGRLKSLASEGEPQEQRREVTEAIRVLEANLHYAQTGSLPRPARAPTGALPHSPGATATSVGSGSSVIGQAHHLRGGTAHAAGVRREGDPSNPHSTHHP